MKEYTQKEAVESGTLHFSGSEFWGQDCKRMQSSAVQNVVVVDNASQPSCNLRWHATFNGRGMYTSFV